MCLGLVHMTSSLVFVHIRAQAVRTLQSQSQGKSSCGPLPQMPYPAVEHDMTPSPQYDSFLLSTTPSSSVRISKAPRYHLWSRS
ncbi:hypothetical protein VTI74DRAFT_10944 [Chaetomium olivicolor]